MTVTEPSTNALQYALMLSFCNQSALVYVQFFARGLFATPSITHFKGPGEGVVDQLRMYGWAARALTLSALDWPLRRVSKGKLSPFPFCQCPSHAYAKQSTLCMIDSWMPSGQCLSCKASLNCKHLEPLNHLYRTGAWCSRTAAVPSAQMSYDKELAGALWDLTADRCSLSRD